ncbi:hypothetical protein [Deinococcus maricopensis]|uniref:hypothetical protein n=1 Tax=Deinococcus maricopensis TaxID=309887 RepID=UPI000300031F|nr:hypothetical protein [Deinococcus maricopensis]
MLKLSLTALAVLLAFGLVFALLPSKAPADTTGIRLEGVSLQLYPARDPDAQWRFGAQNVQYDPVSNESVLTGLSRGERWVPNPQTGTPELDTTLSASTVKIDGSDNLLMNKAQMVVVRECTSLDLSGTAQEPVKVDQAYGYTAPNARIRFPDGTWTMRNVRASFDLKDTNGEDQALQANLDQTQRCENGRLVPVPANP